MLSYWLSFTNTDWNVWKKSFGNPYKDQMFNSSIYLSFPFNFELVSEGGHICMLEEYSSLIRWRGLISLVIIYILMVDTDNYLTIIYILISKLPESFIFSSWSFWHQNSIMLKKKVSFSEYVLIQMSSSLSQLYTPI